MKEGIKDGSEGRRKEERAVIERREKGRKKVKEGRQEVKEKGSEGSERRKEGRK